MKRDEFIRVCRAVGDGVDKHVEHHLTHGTAKVIACEAGNFKVESDGKLRSWAMQNCDESS